MLGMVAPAPKAAAASPPAPAAPPPIPVTVEGQLPTPAPAAALVAETSTASTSTMSTPTERATGTVAPTQPNSLAESKPSAAADAGKPNIAVYVTGEAPEEEKRALGTRILASLVNSGRYRGIERSSVLLAEIDREMVRQRSGAIDDDQISELGKRFGVKYICITDLTSEYDAFQVSARIVNVETAEVLHIGEAFCPQKTALYITWVSENVVRKMFGQKFLPEPSDPSRVRISAGAGALIPAGLGGGVTWGNGEAVAMPYIGAGYDFSLSGKLQFSDGEHYVFNGRDGRHGATAMSAMWVLFGGGLDVDMGKSLYLRAEFLYGLRTASGYESAEASASSGDGWAMPGHGLTIKVGGGAKFAELKF